MTSSSTLQPPAPWAAPSPRPGPIRTPRLVLRSWLPEDAAGMLEAVNAERESLVRWLPWGRTDNRNVAECVYNIERFRRNSEPPDATEFVFGIFDHEGRVVGGTGLHRIARDTHEGEIGYWVRGDQRRRGLCTEAAAHLLSSALTAQTAGGWGLRRVKIVCSGRNAASAGVPRRLGLREEARFAQSRWVEGAGWDDTLVWGVLAHEWDTRAHRLAEPG